MGHAKIEGKVKTPEEKVSREFNPKNSNLGVGGLEEEEPAREEGECKKI